MSEAKKITTAYDVIDKTGKLANACHDQRNKPDDQKSQGNFKLHFSKEYKDYKDKLATKIANSYKANKVVEEPSDLQHYVNEIQQKANKDSTNFEFIYTKHNELILKME